MARFNFLFLIFIFLFSGIAFADNPGFHKILQTRRSCRHFMQKEIPAATSKTILEDARMAPSAGNRQPWEMILVTAKELRSQVFKNIQFLALDLPEINERPAAYVIFLCASRTEFVDAAFSAANLINSAWAEGVGSCLVGSFNKTNLKKVLKIPRGLEIFLVVALGYPVPEKIPQVVERKESLVPYKGDQLKVPKKSLREILFFNQYGVKNDAF